MSSEVINLPIDLVPIIPSTQSFLEYTPWNLI